MNRTQSASRLGPLHIAIASLLVGEFYVSAASAQDLPTRLTLTDATKTADSANVSQCVTSLSFEGTCDDQNRVEDWLRTPSLWRSPFDVEEQQQPERKQEGQQPQEQEQPEWRGGFRIGALIPTSAKQEKLSAFFAAGLFYFTDFVDDKKKWRIELGLDLAIGDQSGIDDQVYLFKGGGAYRLSTPTSPTQSYLVGGLGYALEHVDFGFGTESFNAVLFYIGALVRFNRFDIRLDYCAFAGSDNTTGAVYLTAALWF